MLAKEPPGTVIKCITAQVVTRPEGAKIELQGLHESDFTPDQMALIQAQVKQQLLKGNVCFLSFFKPLCIMKICVLLL